MKFTPEEIQIIDDVQSGEIDIDRVSTKLMDKLYEHFVADMPYGTQKARDGDPTEYIIDHLHEILRYA